MALKKINGRIHFFNCDELEIEPVSAGRHRVAYDGREFVIVGGRASGGAANEWFVHHPLFFGDTWLPAKSMVAALKLGIQY